VRVYHKPFIDWIWGGCLFMAIGGLLAAADRRYRVPVKALAPTPPPVSAPAAQPRRKKSGRPQPAAGA
jgi:cytochrome c-type biogenesis protein CcmF